MWSSRLFLKLFLAYAGLIVLLIGACSAIVAGWQEEQLVEQVRRRLRDSATLLGHAVKQEILVVSGETLQRQVAQLGEQTETRFTLVDAAGTVLADSEQPTLAAVAMMDNHLNRQEFVQAKHSGSGSSRRLSPTLQTPFLYCAIAIRSGGEAIGFVRAAQSIDSILVQVASLQRLIGFVGLGVGAGGLVISYWLTKRIVQPIHSLIQATEEMTAGNAPKYIGISARDEIGALASAFQRMFDRLGRRERALQESADRQSTLLSGMNDGVLAVDSNQRVLFANLAAGRILRFSPEQADQRTLLELARSNDLYEIVQRALATQQPVRSEIEWQTDVLQALEVNATPLPGDPCPGVVLVLHDISELKRLEGLRQQFVANVSHELKTPLSSIKAYTETLLRDGWEDRENAHRFLMRIDDQTDRLHELILDLLALARLEAGRQALELTDLRLSRVANTCVADIEARAKTAQVSLRNEIAESRIRVHADEEGLRQVFENLVDNALKYTPPGGTITLRCHMADSRPGEAIIEIADTGLGIDPLHHSRLFERFYRVDKARSRELGGTGLGLAIVKHLCQIMGGSVEVESEPGKGSTFRVRLPVTNP